MKWLIWRRNRLAWVFPLILHSPRRLVRMKPRLRRHLCIISTKILRMIVTQTLLEGSWGSRSSLVDEAY
jgi:hypothetical protein